MPKEIKIACPHCGEMVLLKVDNSARLIAEKIVKPVDAAKPDADSDDIVKVLTGGE